MQNALQKKNVSSDFTWIQKAGNLPGYRKLFPWSIFKKKSRKVVNKYNPPITLPLTPLIKSFHKTIFTWLLNIRAIPSATYHPLLCPKPLHKESLKTFLKTIFFHNMPSAITLFHSLHTNSAAHKDFASRYERIFSAICCWPFAAMERGNSSLWWIWFCSQYF